MPHVGDFRDSDGAVWNGEDWVVQEVRAYRIDTGGYVVSYGGAWVPGVYPTEVAALKSGELYGVNPAEWAAEYAD